MNSAAFFALLLRATAVIAGCASSSAQKWSAEPFDTVKDIYIEWNTKHLHGNTVTRLLRNRLWLRSNNDWAFLCEDASDSRPSWSDAGVRGDVSWMLSGPTLLIRPVRAKRRGLAPEFRDPELAGGLLLAGHFLWGGMHLASVLGPEAGRLGDTSWTTEFGCRLQLTTSRDELTILSNPAVPQQNGVRHCFREPTSHATYGRVYKVVESYEPGQRMPLFRLELSLLRQMASNESIPSPIDEGQYPRDMRLCQERIDTRPPLQSRMVRGMNGEWAKAHLPRTWMHYGLLAAFALIAALMSWKGRQR